MIAGGESCERFVVNAS